MTTETKTYNGWANYEALRRRKDNARLNPLGQCIQFAYSPTFNTVGCKWEDERPESGFRIFNVHYPMFGRSEEVNDWIALAPCLPKFRGKL